MSFLSDDTNPEEDPVQYGLLANKNSLLFTRLPNSLFSLHTLDFENPESRSKITGSQISSVSSHISEGQYGSQKCQCSTPNSTKTVSSSKSFSSLKGFASRTTSKASTIFSSLSFSSSTSSLKTSISQTPKETAFAEANPRKTISSDFESRNSPCTTQLAILDLVTYFDLVNMYVCAKVSPPIKFEQSDVTYTTSLEPSVLSKKSKHDDSDSRRSSCCSSEPCPISKSENGNTARTPQSIRKLKQARKIRKFMMSEDVLLTCFERKFLHKIILEYFENPFDDGYEHPVSDKTEPSSEIAANTAELSLPPLISLLSSNTAQSGSTPVLKMEKNNSGFENSEIPKQSAQSENPNLSINSFTKPTVQKGRTAILLNQQKIGQSKNTIENSLSNYSTNATSTSTNTSTTNKSARHNNTYNSCANSIVPTLGDSCLHVELVHPVEHGNLHFILASILDKDNRSVPVF